jgi:tripartite-type tricarboxylate transporter receptor subunit TctC
MNQSYRNLFIYAGLAGLAISAAPNTAMADSVADFYKGKRATMFIGYSAGGGYDRYGRSVARHIGRHIPGNPRIVSKNYTGAGGMRLANSIYNTFKQDGRSLAIIGRQIPLEDLTGNKKAKFKANKFNWLGSANQETSTCAFWHTSPIKTVDDMFTKNPIVGGVGTGAGGEYAMLLNNLAGTKLRLITGYPGGVDINLAMERGEVHGRCAWSWSSIQSTAKKWVDQKKVVFPIQIAMTKHKDLPNVPLVGEFIKNKLDRQALRVILAPLTMGRPFAVGPKVPADRVVALRAAFDATMKDKTFLKEAKKGRLPINPASGADIQKLLAGLYALPANVIKHAGDALSRTNNIKISKAVVKTYVHKGKITNVKRGGKRVKWKGKGKKGKLRVGGKTKVSVAGKKSKRKALKVGMSCTFTVKGAQKALKIDCS